MRKQYKEQIARIQAAIDKWVPLLDLDHFEIRYAFVPAVREDDAECAADTKAKWQYRHAGINFYLPHFCCMTDEHVENIVVHEHVHILTASMEEHLSASKTDLGELAVENITRAILKAGSK